MTDPTVEQYTNAAIESARSAQGRADSHASEKIAESLESLALAIAALSRQINGDS